MKKINKIFKNHVVYFDYARSGILYLTIDENEKNELLENGWKVTNYKNEYRCIPPSIFLTDITDIKKIMYHNNIIFTYAFYLFIKDITKKRLIKNYIEEILLRRHIYYKDFNYHISVGPIITTSMIIEGVDKRIITLKHDIIDKFIKSKIYLEYYSIAEKEIGTNKIISKVKNELKKEFPNFFDIVEENNKNNKKYTYEKDFYHLDTSILNYNNYDVILFIPNGCYKFMYSFIESNNINKIMFWEFHIDKTKEGNLKFFEKDLNNKRVLIIDSVYSGKTLSFLKTELNKLNCKTDILGLFPKDKSVLNLLTYTCIVNKVISVDKIKDSILENVFLEVTHGG